MRKKPCVYMLASDRNGTLYIGVTSDIATRASQHREGMFDGFAKTYDVKRLVYVEFHDTMNTAITREKQLKKWTRAWKLDLIENQNPDWADLFDDMNK